MKIPILIVATFLAIGQSNLKPDPPHKCADCDAWNKPYEPFGCSATRTYVGTDGRLGGADRIGNAGSILLDGGLPQSAPHHRRQHPQARFQDRGHQADRQFARALRSCRRHRGAAARERRRRRGERARQATRSSAANRPPTIRSTPSAAPPTRFPAVKDVRAVADGETLRVGDVRDHRAPARPGTHPERRRGRWRVVRRSHLAYNIVYADSLNAGVGRRFPVHRRQRHAVAHRPHVPHERSPKSRALPCDIIIARASRLTDLAGKLKRRRERQHADPFVNPTAAALTRRARRAVDTGRRGSEKIAR